MTAAAVGICFEKSGFLQRRPLRFAGGAWCRAERMPDEADFKKNVQLGISECKGEGKNIRGFF